MAERLHVHLGLHKTGTSTIQNWMNGHRDALGAAGCLVPAAGMSDGAHHGLAYELLGHPKVEPGRSALADLRAEIARSGAADVLISSEEFERLAAGEVDALRRAVGIADIRPILYLRRQDAYLVSDYGQQVKMGASLPDLDAYIDRPTASWRFNYLFVVGNWWGAGLGDRGTVLLYETASADRGLLRSFVDAVGPAARLAATDLDAAPDMNVSWTWQETDLARRATLVIRRDMQVPSPKLLRVYQNFHEEMRAICARLPATPLAPTRAQYERLADQFRASNDLLLKVLPMAEADAAILRFETPPRRVLDTAPETVTDRQVENFAQRVKDRLSRHLTRGGRAG